MHTWCFYPLRNSFSKWYLEIEPQNFLWHTSSRTAVCVSLRKVNLLCERRQGKEPAAAGACELRSGGLPRWSPGGSGCALALACKSGSFGQCWPRTVRWAGERGASRGARRAVGLRHRGGERRGGSDGLGGRVRGHPAEAGGRPRAPQQAGLQVASFSWHMPQARKQGWRCMVWLAQRTLKEYMFNRLRCGDVCVLTNSRCASLELRLRSGLLKTG